MWPIHGRYTCAKCLRQHPVAWDGPGFAAKTGVARAAFQGKSHLAGIESRQFILMPQSALRRDNCVTFPGGS